MYKSYYKECMHLLISDAVVVYTSKTDAGMQESVESLGKQIKMQLTTWKGLLDISSEIWA